MYDNTLTQDNRDKFIQLAKTYKQTIKFYNLEEICPDKIEELRWLINLVNSSGTRTLGNLYVSVFFEYCRKIYKKHFTLIQTQ